MRPVKTAKANFTFLGDGKTVGDVWCERDEESARLTYDLSLADRQEIAVGGRVELALFIGRGSMPPVSLIVLPEADTRPVDEHYEHPLGPDRGEPDAVYEQPAYPFPDGDFTVIGPGCFTDAEGRVISYRGENYVRQDGGAAVYSSSMPSSSWVYILVGLALGVLIGMAAVGL